MNKRIFPIFVFCFCAVMLFSGCNKDKPIILFNKSPITKETILQNTNEFKVGERVYYIFITETPIKSDFVRIQLLKKDEKTTIGGYKIVQANDYRVFQDQVYYYNDYIVAQEKGLYVLQVFDSNYLEKPLARDYFYVKQ